MTDQHDIIVDAQQMHRPLSLRFVHPMVQNPSRKLWYASLFYTATVVILKAIWQIPYFCACYRPWTGANITSISQLSIYSTYGGGCVASDAPEQRQQCAWKPAPAGTSQWRPFDQVYGVQKVYDLVTGPGIPAASLAEAIGGGLIMHTLPDILVAALVLIHIGQMRKRGVTAVANLLRGVRETKAKSRAALQRRRLRHVRHRSRSNAIRHTYCRMLLRMPWFWMRGLLKWVQLEAKLLVGTSDPPDCPRISRGMYTQSGQAWCRLVMSVFMTQVFFFIFLIYALDNQVATGIQTGSLAPDGALA